MKEYTVIIPEMEFTIKAEDESEAEIQAIGLFDWGNVDIEVMETNLSLDEAKRYCSRPDTKGKNWFCGFTQQN